MSNKPTHHRRYRQWLSFLKRVLSVTILVLKIFKAILDLTR